MDTLIMTLLTLLAGLHRANCEGINLCSDFPPKHLRSAELYIHDREGDGSLRLCHCQVYANDFRPYVASALAIATGESGITLRTLSVGRRNATVHLLEGLTYSSTEVLSIGVTYLKSSRQAATFVLSLLPLSHLTDLIVRCTSRSEGHLPDEPTDVSPTDTASNNEREMSGSQVGPTVIALSVLIIALVAIIMALAFSYMKVKRRYSMIKQVIQYNEKGGLAFISPTGSKLTQNYENVEAAYEPIPEATFPDQIHKFRIASQDKRPTANVRPSSTGKPPVSSKKPTGETPPPLARRTAVKTMPSQKKVSVKAPPRVNRKTGPVPTKRGDSYASIDPNHVMSPGNEAYSTLERNEGSK